MKPRNQDTTKDFRLFLQRELVRRCKNNSSYSLRAFSKFLKTDASYLSKILAGKRKLTPPIIKRLGLQLGLRPNDLNIFNSSAETILVTTSFQQLADDSFQLISDWYHYAILELISVKNFSLEPQTIAKSLGIKVIEANDALERLHRLGMISKNKKGQIITTPKNHTTVGTAHKSEALRKLQKQILTMAITALDETPIEERDQSAMTMAIDTRLIPEAKEKIKTFRRDLCAFLESGSKKDRVYHLSLSLYPISKKINKEIL